MKKWKHLFKAAVISAVIAMTAVQVCSAAEAGFRKYLNAGWRSA